MKLTKWEQLKAYYGIIREYATRGESQHESILKGYFVRGVYLHEEPQEWVLDYKTHKDVWMSFVGKTREAVWVAFRANFRILNEER